MKKLIIARHSEYFEADLTAYGQKRAAALGEAILSVVNGHSVTMASSSAPRAQQSARIIADILGIEFTTHEKLWTGPDSPRGYAVNLGAALDIADESGADICILVTHLEYSEHLPTYVAAKRLGGAAGFPDQETDKSEAWVIDFDARTCTRLKPEMTVKR